MKMIKKSGGSILCAAVLATSAHAENGCPTGYEPWKIPVETFNDCVAIPDYGHDAQQVGPRSAGPPQAQWVSRWGAIATGASAKGTVMGTARDAKTQRMAEKAAIKECRNQGGAKTCAIEISYRDQCAVMVWGDGYSHSARAATIERASSLAISACENKTDHCKVYYSNCSYPVKVR